MKKKKEPRKCSNCKGTGKVAAGFYSLGQVPNSLETKSDDCKSCGGSGTLPN